MSEDDWEPKKSKKPVPYEVGKYHPPKHTRFKPGQSGNPKGRKKKPVHIGAAVDELLNGTVTVLIDGKKVRMSRIEVLLQRVYAAAAKGDARMTKLLVELFKLRPDVTAKAPGPQVDEARMNSKIDDILKRLQEEKAEEERLKAEEEAKKNGAAPPA
jgi:Family of unknown function (DUF5681)